MASLKIGVIGVGHLLTSMIPSMAGAGHDIFLSRRNEQRSSALASAHGLKVTDNNQGIVDGCDVIILAVRPQDAVKTAEDVTWSSGKVLVSVCAGIGLEELQQAAPAATIVLSMPVVAAEFQQSPTAIHPDNALATKALEACGPVIAIASQSAFMQASAFGCYYGWVLEQIRHMANWAQEQGVEEEKARVLVAQMTKAAATVALERKDETMSDLVGEVTRPGSYTGKGVEFLNERSAFKHWSDAAAMLYPEKKNH